MTQVFVRLGQDQSVHVGERLIVADVLRFDGEWVDLLVRDSKVVSEKSGWKVRPVATGTEVRRKRQTVEKGKPERLLWSDQSVRALLIRRRLTDTPPASEEANE